MAPHNRDRAKAKAALSLVPINDLTATQFLGEINNLIKMSSLEKQEKEEKKEPAYHIYVRLPFNRPPGFVDPPPVRSCYPAIPHCAFTTRQEHADREPDAMGREEVRGSMEHHLQLTN